MKGLGVEVKQAQQKVRLITLVCRGHSHSANFAPPFSGHSNSFLSTFKDLNIGGGGFSIGLSGCVGTLC